MSTMRPTQSPQPNQGVGTHANMGSAAGSRVVAMRRPRVLVLLAAYNGSNWIRQQIESILSQEQIELLVVIGDDGSADATLQEVARFATDPRVKVPAHCNRAGSAAQNFLSLIAEHPADEFDFVAFSDQDDVWHPDKLIRACRALADGKAVGYSSATVALWSNGRSAVLSQVSTTTAADFLFEGAGQGCTFVLRADFYAKVREFLRAHRPLTRALHYHDWMIYALARAWGHSWTFDPSPSLTYRQHSENDTGARGTLAGTRKRLALLKNGWYGRQLVSVAEACVTASPNNEVVRQWAALLCMKRSWRRRLRLASLCIRGGRRRTADNIMVVFAALLGWI